VKMVKKLAKVVSSSGLIELAVSELCVIIWV